MTGPALSLIFKSKEVIVKPKKIIKTIVLALVFVILVHAAAPLARAAEMTRSCEGALNRCMIVAAFLPGSFYVLYCIDGYIFCKKYLE